MEIVKAEGDYTLEKMQQMATVASTANGLMIEGNNFKVGALTGCPDMVLFACERIECLEKKLQSTQVVDKPEIKSCWPEEIGTDEIQDWDSFEIRLWSSQAGDFVEDWGGVKAVLANAGYTLVKT